ncbi:MAG: AbrB/MazE/SpoVT family DNA-binding domain-containing protein [Chloroflexota bacterium]|nr:MAG: AbrB/MazE/SpoVT family DNA-binding domain-containing protein [Chloroflexota bacterium]
MQLSTGGVTVKEILSTLTQRGQVTVPAEVRRILHLRPKDKVAFQIDDDEVRLVPAKFTLETAFGSVRPKSHPEDIEAIADAAKEEHVEQVIKKMRQRRS